MNYFIMFIFKTRPAAPLMKEGKVRYFERSDDARNFMLDHHRNQKHEIHCIGNPGVF